MHFLKRWGMQVEVLEAREIPKMDSIGSSDPLVKIFTDPKRILKTATKKNTLNPVWENEVFYLMVQVRTCFSSLRHALDAYF